jgi:penicillin-binding protein 1A
VFIKEVIMDNKKIIIPDRKRKKKKFKAWKAVLLVIVLVMLISIGAFGGIVLAYINTAPRINTDNFVNNLALATKIYDKDGNHIEDLHGIENRTYVPLSKIKKYTQDAFIAIEDERFNEHKGVDIKRIFGALWADIKSRSPEQGASTITQQLIKKTILSDEKTIKRKIQEAYLAIKLEEKLSKEQILEYYLNTIPLGGPAYGVQAAAEFYFNKNVDQLTIAQSALIAGITRWPSKYNPYRNEKTPEVYIDRTTLVLTQMVKNNMITQDEFNAAKEELKNLKFEKRTDNTTLQYQWFIEASIDSISKDLKAKYRLTDDEIQQKIYTGGLRIYTTIDPKIQVIADKIANTSSYYPVLKSDIAVWGKDKTIQPQIAIVVEDYKTGQVRAVVGGRGQQPLKSQNRATDTRYARQPGLSMKPLAVYAPAFDLGYSPATVMDDAPFTAELANATNWLPPDGPHNYGGPKDYKGAITVRDAIKLSRNVSAAKLMLQIKPGTSVEYIKKFGISTLVLSGRQNDTGPAIALGGLTKGVIPLEMSAAFGLFGNEGVYVEPVLYTKVLDSEGNVLLEKTPEKHKAISPQAAYLITDCLRTAVNNGTGTNAKLGGMPAAGKTGTTEDRGDIYFSGFTPYYSAAIWMGHDKPSIGIERGVNSNRDLASSITAKMWGDMMKEIHKGLAYKNFPKPSGLVNATVCADSGKLPTALCSSDPRGARLVSDLFVSGTVPSENCDIHVTALVDKSTGKLANEFCPPEFVQEMVFIKRPYPIDKRVPDYKYQVPTEVCTVHTTHTVPTPTPTPSPEPRPSLSITPTISPWISVIPTPTKPGKPKVTPTP